MSNEPIVYLAQDPPPVKRNGTVVNKDLSSAQRYGALRVLLSANDSPSITPGPCLHKIRKALRNFNPTTDYICYAGGDALALALAFVSLSEMGFREITTLRYDRERDTHGNRTKGGYYVPVSVVLRT